MIKNSHFFYILIIAISVLVVVFHFIRLSLGWSIIIAENWELPTLFSGFMVLFFLFISYWSWVIFNQNKKEDKNNSQ